MSNPTKQAPIKDPVLQEQTRIVRILESNLKVRTEDPVELRFRASLLRKVTAEIGNLNSSLVTRLYEAVCAVEFPKDEILAFRKTLQAQIGRILTLKEHSTPKP